MKIIHYYKGKRLTDEVVNRARSIRAEGHLYNFRDPAFFTGIERCDAVVCDDEAIVRAYEAVGVGEFSDAMLDVKVPSDTQEEAPNAPEPQPEVLNTPEPEVRVSVYKIIDGKKAERASKVDLTPEEADEYIAERPNSTYEVVPQ